MLDGMVIGPLDKNNGECSIVCPVIYQTTLERLYGSSAGDGYQRVYAQIPTAKRKRDLGMDGILNNMVNSDRALSYTHGERAIIDTMAWWYRKKGYHKITRFNQKGSFGVELV